MGNTVFSSGACVAVKIEDPGTHFGGSTVRGRVYLDVQKPTVSADSLNIRFYGREHTCVVYHVRTGEHTQTRYAHATNHFYDVDYILCSFPGAVQQGRYEFPFEIRLPIGIPGKQGGSSAGSFFVVDYHAEARLHRQGMLTWDVKNSMEVLMLDPPYNRIPTPVFSTPSTVPVHSFCCIRSGSMTLAIKLDSNNVVATEAFRVFYEISNQSSCRVKALEISVIQNLVCRAQGHVNNSSIPLFHQRIDASKLQNAGPVSNQETTNVAAVQPDQGKVRTLVDSLARGNHFLNVIIPATAAPSLNGVLGSISHILRVQIKTPFGVEDPGIDCPLIVHRTAFSFAGVVPAVEHEFTLPPGWQPMYPSPIVQFELPRLYANHMIVFALGNVDSG